MNNQELNVYIAWLEEKIIEAKQAMMITPEDQDDELQYAYNQGELNAFLLVLDKINTR